MNSTFWTDGYRDGWNGLAPCTGDDYSCRAYWLEYEAGFKKGAAARNPPPCKFPNANAPESRS